MFWVGSALFGAALLHSPQRAEAGWHERHNRDVEALQQRGAFETAEVLPSYGSASSPLKFDETITYAGSNWFAQQETLDGRGGVTASAEQYSSSTSLPEYEPPHSRYPGSSLLSLATLLQSSNPQLRSALMRHLCLALARLRTRFLGLNSETRGTAKHSKKKKKNGKSKKKKSEDPFERRIEALTSRLAGVLAAAEGSANPGMTLSKFLLLAFVSLVREIEELLSDIALQGDSELMITALNRLAPSLVRGLVYLDAPQNRGAAEVLEPARENLLERARELDSALLEAQGNLEGVLRAYPRDFDTEEIEREKQLAALEGSPGQEKYITPVYAAGLEGSSHSDKFRKQARLAFFLSLFLTLSTVLTAIALTPPLLKVNHDMGSSGASQHRRRRGRDGKEAPRGSGSSGGGDSEIKREPRREGGTQRLEEAVRRHREWIRQQQQMAAESFAHHHGGQQGTFEAMGAPLPSPSYAEGHFIQEPGSPLPPPYHQLYFPVPQNYSGPTVPSAPPLGTPPLGTPFLRVPGRLPAYDEVASTGGGAQ